MSFVPRDIELPKGVETADFRLRPITIHDVVKDYDAVMTNREYLWSLFGDCWGWPRTELTLEQDLIDLAWHQKEGQIRRSFTYAVLDRGEQRLLGCVYIDPCAKDGFDAELYYWLRRDGVEASLESSLLSCVKDWLREEWPFSSVAFPGREIPWQEWHRLS